TALKNGAAKIAEQQPFVALFRQTQGKLDQELFLAARGALTGPDGIADITACLGKLEDYLTTARKWYAFALLAKKKMARQVLSPLGLAVGAAQADRAKEFLLALRS